jgi:CRP-like cAMP-binding protein
VSHSGKNIGCDKCTAFSKGIFCQLDLNDLPALNGHKVMNTYKKGHVLFYQGNPPFGLYCISSGKIKITKVGNDGKESIVRIASNGDVLGHRSLFSNENYNATATAMEDSSICFIDKKFILKLVHDQPSIALNIIQKLSREMGSAESKSASMFQKNVRERLAELLLTLAASYGLPEKNRIRLDIKLTREEMASMIGTASETLIRFITEFKEQGFIQQEGKIIFILDKEGLMDFANINY